MCFKFEKGFSLKIREKMFITGSQTYMEVVQLGLRAEKLTGERISQSNFQKRKGFGFMSGQSSKKSKSFESSGNSSRSETGSVSFPQSIQSPQPSKLGTSPLGSTFRGRTMSERCTNYRQFHMGTCGTPHVCFHCG